MRQTFLTSGLVVAVAGAAFAAAFVLSHRSTTPAAAAVPPVRVPVLALPKAHPVVRALSTVAALPAAPAVVHVVRATPVVSRPVTVAPVVTHVAPAPKPQSTVIIPVPGG